MSRRTSCDLSQGHRASATYLALSNPELSSLWAIHEMHVHIGPVQRLLQDAESQAVLMRTRATLCACCSHLTDEAGSRQQKEGVQSSQFRSGLLQQGFGGHFDDVLDSVQAVDCVACEKGDITCQRVSVSTPPPKHRHVRSRWAALHRSHSPARGATLQHEHCPIVNCRKVKEPSATDSPAAVKARRAS